MTNSRREILISLHLVVDAIGSYAPSHSSKAGHDPKRKPACLRDKHCGELCLDLGRLQRLAEPAGELQECPLGSWPVRIPTFSMCPPSDRFSSPRTPPRPAPRRQALFRRDRGGRARARAGLGGVRRELIPRHGDSTNEISRCHARESGHPVIPARATGKIGALYAGHGLLDRPLSRTMTTE